MDDEIAKAFLYQLTRIADALASIALMAETEREENFQATAHEYRKPD